MIYNTEIHDAALEKHKQLIAEADTYRQIQHAAPITKKPVMATIGRLLINVGERLEATADENELKRAYR